MERFERSLRRGLVSHERLNEPALLSHERKAALALVFRSKIGNNY